MSPLQIHCLLDIYVGSELMMPATDVRKAVLDGFARVGITECASGLPSGYDLTGLGKAYIALLLDTPIPHSKFTDPRTGDVIDVDKRR